MDKKEILDDIIKEYTSSNLFNGVTMYDSNYDTNLLCELIDEDLIELQSFINVEHPFEKYFNIKSTKECQKEDLINKENGITLFPTKKALKNIKIHEEKPFTNMLLRGEPKAKLLYFDTMILNNHVNNPQFNCLDNGYSGSIYLKDEYYTDDNDGCKSIKVYGKAYKSSNLNDMCIVLFLEDLHLLNSRKQLEWKSYLLDDQEEYKIEEGFIVNQILGEFYEKHSIYDAVLDEMILINYQFEILGLPRLFRKTYNNIIQDDKPLLYKQIANPTKKNYDDFVEELEKILVGNINEKCFTDKEQHYFYTISNKNDDGSKKGSLTMFSEWLKKNIRKSENMDEDIIKPLRNLRKKRQEPAHDILMENELNNIYFEKQRILIHEIYVAIRNIRLLFSNHPKTKLIKIPDYLIKGENIINY